MTSKDNIIFYIITAVVFVGIVVCSLLFHNPGQPTNGDSDSGFMTIIAFSPFVTAAATVVLAFITWRYVRLTGSLLKATYKPQIFVSLRYKLFVSPSGAGGLPYQNVCVKNIGVGPARKVRFGGDLSFTTKKGNSLQDIGFIKNGIDALAPGEEIRDSVYLELESVEKHQPVLITVTYTDSMGGDYDDEFTLDFNDRTERR